MKDSEFLKLMAAHILITQQELEALGAGPDGTADRLTKLAEEAMRREALLERYPEATPVSLVKLVLPQPIPTARKLDLHELFPHFSSLIDEGYGAAEFMAVADVAMAENHSMFLEYAEATGRREGVRARPWFDLLEDTRESEVRKVRGALASALAKEFPEQAARIAVDIGYAMGVEDGSGY